MKEKKADESSSSHSKMADGFLVKAFPRRHNDGKDGTTELTVSIHQSNRLTDITT